MICITVYVFRTLGNGNQKPVHQSWQMEGFAALMSSTLSKKTIKPVYMKPWNNKLLVLQRFLIKFFSQRIYAMNIHYKFHPDNLHNHISLPVYSHFQYPFHHIFQDFITITFGKPLQCNVFGCICIHLNVILKNVQYEISFDRLWYPLSILLLAAIEAKLIGPHGGLQVDKNKFVM